MTDYTDTPPAHSSFTRNQWLSFLDRASSTGPTRLTEKTPWGTVEWASSAAPVTIVVANPNLPVSVAHRVPGSYRNATSRGALAIITFIALAWFTLHAIPGFRLGYAMFAGALAGLVAIFWPTLRNLRFSRWVACRHGIDPFVEVLHTISSSHALADRPETLHLVRTTMWDAAQAGLRHPAADAALEGLMDLADALTLLDSTRPRPRVVESVPVIEHPDQSGPSPAMKHFETLEKRAGELITEAAALRLAAADATQEN